MTVRQVVKIRASEAASLGKLRQAQGDVHDAGEFVWYRLQGEAELLDSTLKTLPGHRYCVSDDGQLTAVGESVPKGHLPDGHWTRLDEWMSIQLEPAGLAGQFSRPVELRIVRGQEAFSGQPRSDANVLLIEGEAWRRYAGSTAQLRLDQLSFAMNSQRQVVVRGTPLPPLVGTRFVEQSGVAVEAGWSWAPAVDAAVIASLLELSEGDLALLHADREWDLLKADDFVRATRSAVRASTETANDGEEGGGSHG